MSHLTPYRRAGFLMDDCRGAEEVVEGEGVYLHQGETTELLRFEPGDVLGMLFRLDSSSGYTPLLKEEGHSTGLSIFRNGPSDILSPDESTSMSPILSLEICESHSVQAHTTEKESNREE